MSDPGWITIASLPLPFAEPVFDWMDFWRMGTVIVLTGAAAVGLSLKVRKALQNDRKRHGPANRMLLRNCGLDRREQRLIIRLARKAGLEHPASMLISQGCFEHAMNSAATDGLEILTVEKIRGRLFEGMPREK